MANLFDDPSFLASIDPRVVQSRSFFNGLTNLGASMLANSGYSPTPRSGWAGLGQGLGAFNQGYQGYQRNAMGNALQAMQAQEMMQDASDKAEWRKTWQDANSMVSPAAVDPGVTSVAGATPPRSVGLMGPGVGGVTNPMLKALMGHPVYGPKVAASMLGAGAGDDPASVKAYRFWSGLPSDEAKANFIRLLRGDPTVNLGGEIGFRDPLNPGKFSAVIPKTVPPEAQPSLKGEQAKAVEIGGAQAKSAIDLPKIEAAAEQMTKLVDGLISHPGMSTVIGVPGPTGVLAKMGMPIPGTDAAGFMARLDQLTGQQFLQAYETLKGGGPITQIEGEKATNAMSRLMKTGQKETEYREAAEELKGVIRDVVARARAKAGQSSAVAPAAPASSGGLTPEENAELQALRKRFGR